MNTGDLTLGENYAFAKQFAQWLIENYREVVNSAPLYKDGRSVGIDSCIAFANEPIVTFPTAPNVEIDEPLSSTTAQSSPGFSSTIGEESSHISSGILEVELVVVVWPEWRRARKKLGDSGNGWLSGSPYRETKRASPGLAILSWIYLGHVCRGFVGRFGLSRECTRVYQERAQVDSS